MARKLLECRSCHAPTFPPDAWMEHDQRRRAWTHGAARHCHKCGVALRIFVADDYSDDMLARVVTEQEFAELDPMTGRKRPEVPHG